MKILFTSILTMMTLLAEAEDLRKVVDLRGNWKFSIGDNPRWAQKDFDDSRWGDIFVPSPWENEGFNGFDGYGWYRITVDLRNISESNLYLVLGYIDDVDEVYLNGQLIGFSGSFPPSFYTAYNSYRKYPIPENLINKNGKNVIAIRVYDTIHEGGLVKGPVGIFADQSIPNDILLLEGMWKFKIGDNQWWREEDYNDSNWREIIVPGLWRSMKDLKFDETAWYRKTFVLPEALKDRDDLVLLMGVIDDFDVTYINGVFVGETNDGRNFGNSNSYQTQRIYDIPAGLLYTDRPNVIAVRVKDIGGNAGIYKGAIAITPERNITRLLRNR